MTLSEAAAYCGVSETKFRGLYDGPSVSLGEGVRMRRFDREDLDRWINRMKSITNVEGTQGQSWIERAGFRKSAGA